MITVAGKAFYDIAHAQCASADAVNGAAVVDQSVRQLKKGGVPNRTLGTMANNGEIVMQKRYAIALCNGGTCASHEGTGEGGIRTLGSLLGYGALAKRCFQPLSHLTKNRARISRRIADCQSLIAD